MKAFNLMVAIVILFCSSNVNATNYKFVAVDNSSSTKLCMAAVTNNMKSLRYQIRHIRQPHQQIRDIANTVQCNNQIIANIAKTYNALDTFAYLNRFTASKYKKQQTSVTIQDLAAVKSIDKKKKTVVIMIASR